MNVEETKVPPTSVEASKAKAKSKTKEKVETTTTTQIKATKPKKKKLTLEDNVLLHMRQSFRPFSLKTLAAAVPGSTTTTLEYLLLSLLDKGHVQKKDFVGKKSTKTLYWATPAKVKAPTPDAQQEALSQKQSLQQQLRALVAAQEEGLSNAELDAQLAQTRLQWESLSARVATLRAAPVVDTTKLIKRIRHYRSCWQQRKQSCMDVCERVADGLDKKLSQVCDLMDIEVDTQPLPPKR